MIHRLALSALFVAAASSTALGLEVEGLRPLQVVQVDADGKATVSIQGAAPGARVEVMIDAADQGALTEEWQALAPVADGRYAAELTLKAGGPYSVALRALDESGAVAAETRVPGILAGDLWVLAGQSNMQGIGNIDAHITQPHPQVHLLRMNHEWTLAAEPLHILAESPDAVHGVYESDDARRNAIKGSYASKKGSGLGLAFAHAMAESTGRPVGLIATAHGGTSMEQWNPNKKAEGGNSLYGSMLAQVAAAGGKVRGVLWYQGESDANPKDAPTYGDRFKTLIAEMRADFGGPDMPFYYVQIGRFANTIVNHVSWNQLQAEQLRVEPEIAPGGMVASVDLELDDLIHIGTPGLNTLGERLAKLAQRDLFRGDTLAGPRLAAIESFRTPYGHGLRLRFDSVNGGLRSEGRLNGFSLSDNPDGTPIDYIYKQEVDPKDPSALLLWVMKMPATAFLTYGWGGNPYVNVVDEAGMALPCFGPVAVPEDVVKDFLEK